MCENYPRIEMKSMGKHMNNNCANYLGCANKPGSNYPGSTVISGSPAAFRCIF